MLFGGIDGDARDTVLAAVCGISSIKGNEQALVDSMVAPLLCGLLRYHGKAEGGASAEVALETLWNMVEMAGADAVGKQLAENGVLEVASAIKSVAANHQSKAARELRNDLLSVTALLLDSPEFSERALVSE